MPSVAVQVPRGTDLFRSGNGEILDLAQHRESLSLWEDISSQKDVLGTED